MKKVRNVVRQSSSRSYAISSHCSLMVLWLLTQFLHAKLVAQINFNWGLLYFNNPAVFSEDKSSPPPLYRKKWVPRLLIPVRDTEANRFLPGIRTTLYCNLSLLYTQQYSVASNPNTTLRLSSLLVSNKSVTILIPSKTTHGNKNIPNTLLKYVRKTLMIKQI